MHPDIQEILFEEAAIAARVGELAEQISRDYQGKNPLVISVLKGAVFFTADLVKRVTVPLELDFMAISSYGASSQSSGVVRIMKDLERPIDGRHVLICEDIVDTGLTLAYLRDLLARRNAASVRVAALFDKQERRQVSIEADYCGFVVPNRFIVGYGLDYAEQYRTLPYVGVLRPEIYER